jgi:3-oxoacyl-[acyl-carrier-protein] synthase II
MRRVVVTGLGLVTPLGGDVETTWKNILAAKSGAGRITRFDAEMFDDDLLHPIGSLAHVVLPPSMFRLP